MSSNWPPSSISLSQKSRILFLTKDLNLIKHQLYQGLNLKMCDLSVAELLDDINTDVMTPAWACFKHRPEDIAVHAYAGLMHEDERVFKDHALIKGNFEVIVSGYRKGTGSSRETAAQCERFSGIRYVVAASFAPIHERNNINLGQICFDHQMLERLQKGESIKLEEVINKYDEVTKLILKCGGLFSLAKKLKEGKIKLPDILGNLSAQTMVEKIISNKLAPFYETMHSPAPGETVAARVDGGYSHEFTTAQVHEFLKNEFGSDYQLNNPSKFAIFEDHLVYADGVAKLKPFSRDIQTMRDLQNEFQAHTKVRNYSAIKGVSPGICHEIARQEFIEPGDFIQATDSHTCMGGALNSLSFGVGATEYAAMSYSGLALIKVPESIRFELKGSIPENCTAKDVMLYILLNFARNEDTLDRCMEFGGEGLKNMSIDERSTLCNMATECAAKTGICEGDQKLIDWLAERREGIDTEVIAAKIVTPDPGAHYAGGVHEIDLSSIKPMVATPGNPDLGIPSDPTNGAFIEEIGHVPIDIAYGGSCTGGKFDDMVFYARAVKQALENGQSIKDGVAFFIQFGSQSVKKFAQEKGFIDLFNQAGVHLIEPGCGACIGCGPGVSENKNQTTISAINRNFQGRSGPGKLYLASPLSVAASAFAGKIVAYDPSGSY